MSSRLGFRSFQNSRAAFQSASSPFRRNAFRGRRFQSTESGSAGAAPRQNIFQRMWYSPVGVKTVHFWAPVMKWAIVIAGISDFARPAEKLSLTQNGALMATGAIWTRWCMIIKPRNVLLATVNFFLGCVGAVQVSRIFLYRRSLDEGSSKEALKDMIHDTADSSKHAVEKAESAIKKD